MVVKDVCVNRDLLSFWLERLPGHDWSEFSAHALLDPSDAQDVPRAVKLLLCIIELGELDQDELDPSEAADFEALCLLGEAFDALVQPFINIDYSFSQQITTLVKFAHLICGLYLSNGTSFLSNQLYGDLQAMVNNAVLMVPKTRLIDPSLDVFICLLGDDVLESLFGRCRMLGGHSPNCSIGELCDRFGSAMNLDMVYGRSAEFERKLKRLALIRSRGLDHRRPSHWRANILAVSCDTKKCWRDGMKDAEGTLRKHGVKMSITFEDRWKQRNTDLLRPSGGKYPAISAEIDRSMVNLSSDPSVAAPSIETETNPIREIDFEALITKEKAQRAAASAAAQPHSVFAEIDAEGQLVHKKSITRTLFDMTQDTHGSHDRLARVRGFTHTGKSWAHESPGNSPVSASTHFQLKKLFTTLICYNGTHLGLAVCKCTLIKRGPASSKSPSISAVPLAELGLPMSPYTVYGQVFSVLPLSANAAEWAWDGEFVSLSLKKKPKSGSDDVARLRNLQFSVTSRLIDPIQQCAHKVSVAEIHSTGPMPFICSRECT
ncbi:hypothetical protein LshimejAT787_2500370 [Lyophyllum shimeji]|uniref:Uncharacterized protein n=1 Tax=Lyophyllum shimeji TaxID=47721 RepID=A0A9P3PZ09_LYOSH|nr:hypothetical protein LshimejAT787_2500370 [Lyophyllum shimeji]